MTDTISTVVLANVGLAQAHPNYRDVARIYRKGGAEYIKRVRAKCAKKFFG